MKKLIGLFFSALLSLPAMAQDAFDTGILYRRADNLATNTRWLVPASTDTVKFIISNGYITPNPLPAAARPLTIPLQAF